MKFTWCHETLKSAPLSVLCKHLPEKNMWGINPEENPHQKYNYAAHPILDISPPEQVGINVSCLSHPIYDNILGQLKVAKMWVFN